MKIKYWGVRGSIPSPSINGFNTGKYGGNTSCIEITTDGKDTYILDAGTGIRLLGLDMMKRGNIGKQKAKKHTAILSAAKTTRILCLR